MAISMDQRYNNGTRAKLVLTATQPDRTFRVTLVGGGKRVLDVAPGKQEMVTVIFGVFTKSQPSTPRHQIQNQLHRHQPTTVQAG